MANVLEFQNALLSDPEVQAAFAKDPRAVLERYGVNVPAGTEVPDNIPLPELLERVAQIKKGLEEQNTSLEEVAYGGSSAVTSFLEKAVPLSQEELETIRRVQDEFEEDVAAFQLEAPGRETAAVVGVIISTIVSSVVTTAGATPVAR